MTRKLALLVTVMALSALIHAQDIGDAGRAGKTVKGSRPSGERADEKVPVDEETLAAFRKASETLGRTTDRRKIIRAARTLETGFPDSRSVLVDMVEKGRKRARAFALRLLGEKGTAEEDLPVVSRALEDPEASVRLAAVMAIQKLGKEGYPALRRYITTERNPNNRKMAVKTFERWKDPNAVPLLVSLLRTEQDEGVRHFIVSALERLSGRKLGDDQEAWDEFLLDFVPPDQKTRHRDRLLRLLESRDRGSSRDGREDGSDEDSGTQREDSSS